MVCGFQTNSSTYYFDTVNQTITGGIFRDNKVKYTNLRCLIGDKASIKLADGRIVETGIVERYI